MKKRIKALLGRLFPRQLQWIQIYRRYQHAAKNMGYKNAERKSAFSQLVRESQDKDCLQIGVRYKKVGPHWKSVDLFDTSPLIDYNYDVQDMPFEDESFDVIYCPAILEHVPYPQKAVAEFYRILRPGGTVWVEIPFNQPYHPSPKDYWRVSPQGMQVLMEKFEEQYCEAFSDEDNLLFNGIFYKGTKPQNISSD